MPTSNALIAHTSGMGGEPTPALPPPPPPIGIEGQTYCLRWNNHKANLIEILDALIKVESYVDCTIIVDDQVQFKAHRVVLAANSPYFQSILQDVPMDHCSIIFPGVKDFEMRALLEYMYTGEVNVTQNQIPQIMRIAEELEVKGLFDMADLKEKFNKLSEEQAENAAHPYACSAAPVTPSYTAAATSSTTPHNGSQDLTDSAAALHSSPLISTSSNISPSAAPSSTAPSSPPYNSYKSMYTNMYTKPPGPSTPPSQPQAQKPNQQTPSSAGSEHHSQWPISSGLPAAAAAMLSAVYESAPDMNPLKRKKLSSISSMLMSRGDTPILRNVLAQSNVPDSSQPMPLLLPGAPKIEKTSADKSVTHNNNHSFNGSDYTSEKKYPEEPHSPFTDRSYEDDGYDAKVNFSGNFGANTTSQKPEWKRYKQYTRSDIMSAIQCVRDGMSALQASRKFGVPSRTLYDKVKKMGITTGRPMNRSMKRSPNNVESAAFPYAHGYGQSEQLLSSMHDSRDERDISKDHHRVEHHMQHASTIPQQAAALLDHALLQQALENRGGDIAGREALHAMALAAAAHAAVNRMSSSPGPNGTARSPSPNFAMKYARNEHELMLERGQEPRYLERDGDRERRELELENDCEVGREQHGCERDADDEVDHVEDLSVARKDCPSPDAGRSTGSSYSPQPSKSSENCGVIMPPMNRILQTSNDNFMISESAVKREIISEDGRAD